MSTVYTYRYDRQIEKYTAQVMRALSGFQVRANATPGVYDRVPVAWGAPERIVAAINSDQDRFRNYKIPMIGVMLSNFNLDNENVLTGRHLEDIPFKDDVGTHKTLKRLTGPALILNYNTSIYCSSMHQLFEIAEQMLLSFHDGITIQKSTDVFDSNFRSTLRLTNLQNDITYPVGTGRNLISMSADFEMSIRLSYPKEVVDSYIEEINMSLIDDDNNDWIETDTIDETT